MNNAWKTLEPTDQDMEHKSIYSWMMKNKNDHRDPLTREINCTTLAEACALELYPGEWLPETHKVWDIAVDIETEDKLMRDSEPTTRREWMKELYGD